MFRRISIPLLFLLLTLPTLVRAAAPCWEDINPRSILRWSEKEQLCAYQNMERLWSHNTVRAAGPARPLPQGSALAVKGINDFMRANHVRGLLILHRGKVVVEQYRDGFGPEERWTSFSMAKSLTSILAGMAVKRGFIRDLDDRVADYLPELRQGAYAEVTIRQTLSMTSGVAWNENYRASGSNVARLAQFASGTESSFLASMAGLGREAAPGAHFNYSTGEAVILGRVVARTTGKNLSDFMAESLWQGMERDAIWITDASNLEVSGCCFSATLRDYGRVGLFMLEAARLGEDGPFPAWWLHEATRAGEVSKRQKRSYGYQWWIREDGAYQASGIFGQLLHIDPRRELVLVMLGAWPHATGTPELRKKRQTFIDDIRKALDRTAAFKSTVFPMLSWSVSQESSNLAGFRRTRPAPVP